MKRTIIFLLIVALLVGCTSHNKTGTVTGKAIEAGQHHVTITLTTGESRTIEVTVGVYAGLTVGTTYDFRSEDMGSGYRIFDSVSVAK